MSHRRFFSSIVLAVLFVSGCVRQEAPAKIVAADRPHQLLREGLYVWHQGQRQAALGRFAAAIKLAPDLPEAYFVLARALIDLGQHQRAVTVLAAAIGRFQDSEPRAYYFLALACRGIGRLDQAAVAAQKYVTLSQAAHSPEHLKKGLILLNDIIETARELERS